WIVRRRGGGCVGDVLQPEQAVHLADERGGRRRVVGVVELVIDLERLRGLRKRCSYGGEIGAHLLLQRGRFRSVPRGNAQLCDLLVRVDEILGRRLDQDRNVQRGQPVHEASIVIGGDDQVRLVCGDRFDVGLETRELGHRG